MVTPAQALAKYGDPTIAANEGKYMVLVNVPTHLQVGKIPKRIYLNKDLQAPLMKAFDNLVRTGYVRELKSWDGCFNVRKQRGASSQSLHSWGIAIDVNAAENPLGAIPKLSYGFVRCFLDAGFDWGGNWTRKDGMHFQLKTI